MQIVDNSSTTLRAIGKDELWLHQWLVEKPSRLGLGDLMIKSSELIHYKNKGGVLKFSPTGATLIPTTKSK